MKPLNHKERIELRDTMQEILIKLAEGNPGGLNVMLRILTASPIVDPDDMLAPIGPILSLDTHGIYGSNIWILYKDCCGQDIVGLLAVLRSIQMGILSEEEVWEWIDNSTPVNVPETLSNLQKKLPNFNKENVEA